MSKVKTKDLEAYLSSHNGSLVQTNNGGTYNMRGPNGSANIGKPSNNRWEHQQLQRGWGDATGIPKPRNGEI